MRIIEHYDERISNVSCCFVCQNRLNYCEDYSGNFLKIISDESAVDWSAY